ncbi:MAG: acyltransferase family protein [Tannerella sp.]|jgi:fucose 4-O-acetylase-like acetyltransferase|nr:acyltransferase family protein [Tannerella sp.]
MSDTADRRTYRKWIDCAKFVSIFLVVLFHCPPSLSGTVAGVSLSHLRLPSFFFLAGLLFSFSGHPSFIAFARRRSIQLLIPYVCFFAISYLFWLLAGKDLSSPDERAAPFYQPVVEYLYGRPLLIDWPLWFIAALFSMQCLFYLFRKISRPASVVILFALAFAPRLTDLSGAPWMLDNVCDFFFYYGLASLYKKAFFRFMEMKSRFIAGFLLLIIHFICNVQLLGQPDEYLAVPLHLLCGISIIIPLFILIKAITDRRGLHPAIKYMAMNTIIILACHTYGIRLLTLLVTRFMHVGDDFFDGLYGLKPVIAVAVMILMIAPVYVINRYFPFIVGRGKYFNS